MPCKQTLLVAAVAAALLVPSAHAEGTGNRLEADTFSGLSLRAIGPALMSGRVADIAIDPADRSTWYVGMGSGGVWKTVNAGTTWEPLFDHQDSYSIGCVTIDPGDPQTVWVGTGENVSGRHVGYGDGVYRSLDGGKSWENMGLASSEHIGRIVVDPRDSATVWVAAEGPLWQDGGDRGVFKSTDRGRTWRRVLSISERTGVTDLEIDPRDPDVLFAAAYQRRRHVWSFLAGGEESGIFKSTDGGESWTELTNGLPDGDMGKIGLAVSPVDPEVVYATIEAAEEERGLYRSTDAGASWEKRSGYVSGGTGPHYYQEIYASPHAVDRLYQMDVWMRVSEDGGKTFEPVGERFKHSDNHAFAFDPDDPDHLLAGCDGGLYETFDRGATWRFTANLPATQIYKLALNDARPFYDVAGGTQDNGTQVGPSRTLDVHGIRNQDWTVPVGADGYACQFDAENPQILYAEWQGGNLLRVDLATGESVEIQPQPEPGDAPERWNWDAPILVSPHSPSRLWFGSQRLWRSDDRGDSWTAVSGDLSRGVNRYEMELLGRVWSVDSLYDHGAMSWYGNLTAISESPLVEGLVYVGTDDGLVQVTEDGGGTWRRIDRLPGIQKLSFVQEVKASLHDPDTVFAVLDGHKLGDFAPHLLRSTDRGGSWHSISGDLPARDILWSVVQDHVDPELFFVGAEDGIYFTIDGGGHWIELGGAPAIAFRDLEIQRRANDLVGASFGRGFYVLDDYSPLRQISAPELDKPALLFPIRDALWYLPSTPLAVSGKGYQGGGYYTADNPPFGAVFTYYLAEALETSKEARHEREKELREKGEDVPFPGWETLRAEELEHQPQLVFTVRDATGAEVRRLTASASETGIRRIAWDLRYPPTDPVDLEPPGELPPWASPDQGPLVAPGSYTVEMASLVGGELTPLAGPQSFRVVALDNSTLPGGDYDATLAFARRTAELYRKAQGAAAELDRAEDRWRHLERAALETPGAAPDLLQRLRALEQELAAVRLELRGDPVRGRLDEPRVPAVLDRLYASFGHWSSRSAPTRTQQHQLELAEAGYAETSERLRRLVEVDLTQLEDLLEAAGAPWTPGRKIPD